MKNTTRIILICICSLLIILSLAGIIWAIVNRFSDKAYADYEQLNSDTMVNFNQQFKFNNSNTNVVQLNDCQVKTNGNITAQVYTGFKWSYTAGHSYYIYVNGLNSNSHFYTNNSYLWLTESTIKTPATSATNTECWLGLNNVNGIITIYIIDLTQMFGSGNEPNLQQAQEYFIAEYYSYNTGETMPYSISYLNGYQKGIIDFQNSLTTTFNNDVIGSMSFAANIGGIESTIGYNAGYGAYSVEGVAGIHFGNSITSQIEFYIEFFLPNYAGGLYFIVFDYSNGTLIPISTDEIIEGTATTNPYVRSIFNVNNMDTLYFGVFDSTQQFNNSTVVTGYFFKSELTIYTIDIAALITQSIGETQADYLEGGAGYEMIYNQGYYAGVAHGNATLETMDYIGAAFTGIGSILQIQLLPGIPFSIFILLPLMFGLIAFVIKLSKGGS